MKSTLHFLALVSLCALWTVGCDDSTANRRETPDAGTGPVTHEDAGIDQKEDAGNSSGQLCRSDDECPDDMFCNVDSSSLFGNCEVGCRDETYCGSGMACVNNSCPLSDEVDCDEEVYTCAPGMYCDSISGNCADSECDTDDDCLGMKAGLQLTCEHHVCVPLYVCCDNDACSLASQNDCSDVITLFTSCNYNPCLAPKCDNDTECEGANFCDADGRCRPGCINNDQCDDDEVCNVENHECGRVICGNDNDCPNGLYCDMDVALCATGCRDDDNCSDGYACNAVHDCAPRCSGDGQCGSDNYCDREDNVCRVFCLPDTHENCSSREYCISTGSDAGHCARGCRDDAYEDNDTRATASEIVVPELRPGYFKTTIGAIEPLRMCGGDSDFYTLVEQTATETTKLAAVEGRRLKVRLLHDATEADIDFRLFRSSGGTPLNVTGATTELIYPASDVAPENEQFTLQVFANDQSVSSDYALELTIIDTSKSCFLDDRDPGDDTYATATVISENSADFSDAVVCFGDEDWFSFDMNTGDGIHVEVLANSDSEALVISLFDDVTVSSGSAVSVVATGTPQESGGTLYTFDIPANSGTIGDGRYYLQVRGASETDAANYNISFDITRNEPCTNDTNEPNNEIREATSISVATGSVYESPAYMICSGDEDFFKFRVDVNEKVEAWLEPVPGNQIVGTLAVQILDDQGRVLGSSGSLTAAQSTRAMVTGLSQGTYILRVDGLDVAEGGYTLHVQRTDLGSAVCAADIDEVSTRNDTSNNAIPMNDVSNGEKTRFTYETGLMCDPSVSQSDVDWYTFPVVEENSRVCVMLNGFDSEQANLDLEIYRVDYVAVTCMSDAVCDGGRCVGGRCSAPIKSSTTNYPAEMADATKQETGSHTGTHYARVFRGAAGDQTPYSLTATVTPPGSLCNADWREMGNSNDSAETATSLFAAPAAICDTWICGDSDNDWYKLTIPAKSDRTVVISYQNNEGVLLMDYQDTVCAANAAASGNYAEILNCARSSRVMGGNEQCINIKAGENEARDVYINVHPYSVNSQNSDNRIDYSLRVVPVDLSNNPQGACKILTNTSIDACTPANPNNGNSCWPLAEIN